MPLLIKIEVWKDRDSDPILFPHTTSEFSDINYDKYLDNEVNFRFFLSKALNTRVFPVEQAKFLRDHPEGGITLKIEMPDGTVIPGLLSVHKF